MPGIDRTKVRCPCCKYYGHTVDLDMDSEVDKYNAYFFLCTNCGNLFAKLEIIKKEEKP